MALGLTDTHTHTRAYRGKQFKYINTHRFNLRLPPQRKQQMIYTNRIEQPVVFGSSREKQILLADAYAASAVAHPHHVPSTRLRTFRQCFLDKFSGTFRALGNKSFLIDCSSVFGARET